MLMSKGFGPYGGEGFLAGGSSRHTEQDEAGYDGSGNDTRSKMRPDMMVVAMTTAEQQQYLHHDNNCGSRLTLMTPLMPYGNPRSIKIVEGGYCLEEHLQRYCCQFATVLAYRC